MKTNKQFSLFAMTALVLAATTAASAAPLYRQLQLGMSGADVGTLQTFLATDPAVYPQGKVTNYFGYLTKSAVSNFQSKNGISTVGRVGPQTMAVINAQMGNGTVTGNNNPSVAPTISGLSVSVNQNTANIYWNTNEAAKGMVYYNTIPLIAIENDNSVDISGYTAQTDSNYKNSQQISLTGLQSNTTYYYMVYTTDQSGNVSVSVQYTFRTN